jgi:hypothetical protein
VDARHAVGHGAGTVRSTVKGEKGEMMAMKKKEACPWCSTRGYLTDQDICTECVELMEAIAKRPQALPYIIDTLSHRWQMLISRIGHVQKKLAAVAEAFTDPLYDDDDDDDEDEDDED